jgi:DNA excision repair protein ERCC-2
LADLRHAGLRARTLTLTAKDKICIQNGRPCDPHSCPLALGYYDRRKPAMRAALHRETITRTDLEEISRQHQVCPFELSLDLSTWVDAVVCDYNYVFDPAVYLRRHFDEQTRPYTFLIDEAHNLVDRARDMFSADLDSREIREVRRSVRDSAPRCARAMSKLNSNLRKLAGWGVDNEPNDPSDPDQELNLFPQGGGEGVTEPLQKPPAHRAVVARNANRETLLLREIPEALLEQVDAVLKEAETWLARNEPAEFRQMLLEFYFHLLTFRRTAQAFDEHYVMIVEAQPVLKARLFCLDPSQRLREALERGSSAVLFSATLSPLDYYRDLIGGSPEDPTLQLPSPFPPEHLRVVVQDRIRMEYQHRQNSVAKVVEAIAAAVGVCAGNYLVYFSSYEYLDRVRAQFDQAHPEVRLMVQQPDMPEAERDRFLAAFATDHSDTLVGFAVLGGIFGEGIDLVGERLIGAIAVGAGLPQLCFERDLIRDYFDAKLGSGFDYAYTFPGMNRVLQAIGRVIRSETDRGIALLVDARFRQPRYQRLFPRWWRPTATGSAEQVKSELTAFWSAQSRPRGKGE